MTGFRIAPIPVRSVSLRPASWRSALLSLVSLCLLTANTAFAKDRAECEREYRPTFGQQGKDVPWEPTSSAFASAMLRLAATTSSDRVYDLGAGDGAIVIEAAKQFGATAVGIEYNRDLAKLAQCYVEAEGLAPKAKVIQGDIFKTDFTQATVVTLYLWPEVNLRLRPTLLKMPPGTRVVSHMHDMQAWKWDDKIEINDRRAYLWIVPAQAEGAWTFKQTDGADAFTLKLKQRFQALSGTMRNAAIQTDVKGSLRGAKINLDLGGRKLVGVLDGTRIAASLSDEKGERKYVGTASKYT